MRRSATSTALLTLSGFTTALLATLASAWWVTREGLETVTAPTPSVVIAPTPGGSVGGAPPPAVSAAAPALARLTPQKRPLATPVAPAGGDGAEQPPAPPNTAKLVALRPSPPVQIAPLAIEDELVSGSLPAAVQRDQPETGTAQVAKIGTETRQPATVVTHRFIGRSGSRSAGNGGFATSPEKASPAPGSEGASADGTPSEGEPTPPVALAEPRGGPAVPDLATAPAPSALVPDSEPVPPTEVAPERDPLVSVFLIGASSNVIEQRRVGWGIPQRGWSRFVDQYVQPQLDGGVNRFILMNPFGALPEEDMQFDQYPEALQLRYGLLTTGFVEAWKPVTASGAEVIGYIGSPYLDPTSAAFEAEGDWEGFLAHAETSLAPFLATNMSVGLDAAVSRDVDSYTFRLAERLRDRGTRVYVESRPKASKRHWGAYPLVAVDWVWERFEPSERLDADPFLAKDELDEEVILLLMNRPANRGVIEWSEARFRELNEGGYSVGVPMNPYLRKGGTVDDLLRDPEADMSYD